MEVVQAYHGNSSWRVSPESYWLHDTAVGTHLSPEAYTADIRRRCL